MTIEACYAAFGGDYQECIGRLRSEKLVVKFCQKFLDDTSYQTLCDSIAQGNLEEAFRASHTLKGVSQNLAYTRLGQTAHELTEALRPGTDLDQAKVDQLFAQVKENYQETSQALKAFFAQQA